MTAPIPNALTQRGVAGGELQPVGLRCNRDVGWGASRVCSSLIDNQFIDTWCLNQASVYPGILAYAVVVPKLWMHTVEAHRNEVREAILETTAGLVAQNGLRSVTMSQIAEETGIGRATLYKYFPDVEAILVAWHERHVSAHLEYLADVRDRVASSTDGLQRVLEAYALIQHERHATEIKALLHRDEHVAGAQRRLTELLRGLLVAGVDNGSIRDDVGADELAVYCLHALAAASGLSSKAAVRRLVAVTLDGLRPRAREPGA